MMETALSELLSIERRILQEAEAPQAMWLELELWHPDEHRQGVAKGQLQLFFLALAQKAW